MGSIGPNHSPPSPICPSHGPDTPPRTGSLTTSAHTRINAFAIHQIIDTNVGTYTHPRAIVGSPTLEYVAPEGVALHDSRKAAHSTAASCACAHSAARSGVLYTDGTQDRSGSMIDILGLGYQRWYPDSRGPKKGREGKRREGKSRRMRTWWCEVRSLTRWASERAKKAAPVKERLAVDSRGPVEQRREGKV